MLRSKEHPIEHLVPCIEGGESLGKERESVRNKVDLNKMRLQRRESGKDSVWMLEGEKVNEGEGIQRRAMPGKLLKVKIPYVDCLKMKRPRKGELLDKFQTPVIIHHNNSCARIAGVKKVGNGKGKRPFLCPESDAFSREPRWRKEEVRCSTNLPLPPKSATGEEKRGLLVKLESFGGRVRNAQGTQFIVHLFKRLPVRERGAQLNMLKSKPVKEEKENRAGNSGEDPSKQGSIHSSFSSGVNKRHVKVAGVALHTPPHHLQARCEAEHSISLQVKSTGDFLLLLRASDQQRRRSGQRRRA